jgi:hypothetical protein
MCWWLGARPGVAEPVVVSPASGHAGLQLDKEMRRASAVGSEGAASRERAELAEACSVWKVGTRARRAERYAATRLGSEVGDADGCTGGRRAATSQHGRERHDVTPPRAVRDEVAGHYGRRERKRKEGD